MFFPDEPSYHSAYHSGDPWRNPEDGGITGIPQGRGKRANSQTGGREAFDMLFSSWENLFYVIVVGVLVYVGLVTFLRISGKRTLSSMNAFDFIVTVAFGSTMASTILPSAATFADGILALALLILFQFLVAWFEIRFPSFHRIVTSNPTILFFRGEFVEEKMRRERVERGDILSVVRRSGILDLETVEAIILETDGSFSVLTRPEAPVTRSTMENIPRPGSR